MIKYKVLSIEVNKNLENDTLVLSKVSSSKNALNKKTTKSQASMWFSSWVKNSFNPLVNQVNKIGKRLDGLVKNNNLKE